MKKTQKLNFIEWNNNILISSIKKINLNIILIIILDILFYLSSAYLFILWAQRIKANEPLLPSPEQLIAMGYERAQQVVTQAQSYYYLIIFSFVLLLIAVIFLASIFKGIIWAKINNTKISFGLISKFLGLNIIWISFWFLLIFLISYLVEPASAPMFMIITISLGIYFTNTLYTIFMKEQKLRAIISAVKLNITKIHLFLLPYALIFLILFIIANLNRLIKLDALSFFITIKLGSLIGLNYSYILSLLINPAFLLSFALIRYYTSTLVLEIEKAK